MNLNKKQKVHHSFVLLDRFLTLSASKSLINADKIDSIKPSLSGRFEVVLKNKEKLIVSRQYVRVLKHMIGL